MIFKRATTRNYATCFKSGGLRAGYVRIRLHDIDVTGWRIDLFFQDGRNTNPDSPVWGNKRVSIPSHHLPAFQAWACGDMPSYALADYLEENFPEVPHSVLAVMREPQENANEVMA